MSGHSKWATIKHKKGALDAKRGKLFTKLIKELTVAARMGGGDPGGNPRLRKAIADAKGQSMPNDTINRAVKRGTGEIEGAAYEEIIYEGTGPGGTLFLVEAMTDNRNRTVAEIRKIFEKHNGVLGGAGTAGWAFERKGLISLGKDAPPRTSSWRSPSAPAPRTTPTPARSGSSRRRPTRSTSSLEALEKAGIKVEVEQPGLRPEEQEAARRARRAGRAQPRRGARRPRRRAERLRRLRHLRRRARARSKAQA